MVASIWWIEVAAFGPPCICWHTQARNKITVYLELHQFVKYWSPKYAL